MATRLRHEDLSFVDRAPVLARASTVVSASPDRVWPAFAEASAWPQWFKRVKSVTYTSPAPYGVGSTRTVNAAGMTFGEEILAFDPNERYAFTVLTCNLPLFAALVEVITLEPSDAGTTVVYTQALEPKRWVRPRGLLRKQLEGQLAMGLAGLGPWVALRG